MTVNEAIHRMCQQIRSDIDDMSHTAKMVCDPETKSALAEDVGRLQEALDVIKNSGLERRDSAASFIEHVRENL